MRRVFIPLILNLCLIFSLLLSCKEEEKEEISIQISEIVLKDATTVDVKVTYTGKPNEKFLMGVCWSDKNFNPTMSDKYILNAIDLSTNYKWLTITNLKPNSRLYFRAFLIYQSSAIYSKTVDFTTGVGIPKILTLGVENVTKNSLILKAKINFIGDTVILEKGVCWSTSPEPTIFDNKVEDMSLSDTIKCEIKDLLPYTKYYIRPYLKNSEYVAYGDEINVRTKPPIKLYWAKIYPNKWFNEDEKIYNVSCINDNLYMVSATNYFYEDVIIIYDSDGNIIKDMRFSRNLIEKFFNSEGHILYSYSSPGIYHGYIVTSFIELFDIPGENGYLANRIWIKKLDDDGNIAKSLLIGNKGMDRPVLIERTKDENFVMLAYSSSNDGYFIENRGNYDFVLFKFDAELNILWQKCYGGSNSDIATSICETNDNGYILAGYSESNDKDVSINYGGQDILLVKVNKLGEIDWTKSIGGNSDDLATSIKQTNDGGYVVCGHSKSTDLFNNHGGYDIIVIKIDKDGNIQWIKNFGGSKDDNAYSIAITSDGGFIITGSTLSTDGDVYFKNSPYNLSDLWIIRLDENGNLKWEYTYRADNNQSYEGRVVRLINESNFILGGFRYKAGILLLREGDGLTIKFKEDY